VGPYQNHMDGMLNFPLYFTFRDVFRFGQSMWNFEVRFEQNRQYFKDVSLLGNFIDNHDFARFRNGFRDTPLMRNALTYVLFSEGIPIVYQGTEFLFEGGDDPQNRESLWPDLFNTQPQLGPFFKKSHLLRQIAGSKFFDSKQQHVWTQDDLYLFLRGDILVVVTNARSNRYFSRTIKLPRRSKWINILNPNGKDELQITSASDNGWLAQLHIYDAEPKVFYPVELLRESGKWYEFFDKSE
jgi:alpha-amylase